MTTVFDDIRPYQDEEVPAVLSSLCSDPGLLDLAAQAKAGRLHNRLPRRVTRALAAGYLRWRFAGIRTVEEFQQKIAPYVEQLLESTTTQITWEGLEGLSPDQAYLFLSNHRDIVSDPSLVNYILYKAGFGTTRIAIGDNLTENPLVADLMRLNKSFIVRRKLSNPREMRNTYLTLSSFIHQSIREGQSVWMAQREGRAKDGIDKTDPAILKMLFMSQKKTAPDFATAMHQLHIVPVSIAYEYDPCDIAKARELEERERTGTYEKAPGEDIQSMVQGLQGNKGKVHVAFGRPFTDPCNTPQEAADIIDGEINGRYHLFPTNWVAAQKLASREGKPFALPQRPDLTAEALAQANQVLEAHLAQCSPELHRYLLAIYANPVFCHPLFSGTE